MKRTVLAASIVGFALATAACDAPPTAEVTALDPVFCSPAVQGGYLCDGGIHYSLRTRDFMSAYDADATLSISGMGDLTQTGWTVLPGDGAPVGVNGTVPTCLAGSQTVHASLTFYDTSALDDEDDPSITVTLDATVEVQCSS